MSLLLSDLVNLMRHLLHIGSVVVLLQGLGDGCGLGRRLGNHAPIVDDDRHDWRWLLLTLRVLVRDHRLVLGLLLERRTTITRATAVVVVLQVGGVKAGVVVVAAAGRDGQTCEKWLDYD